MPGFLGTQQEFNDKYGKPILAGHSNKGNNYLKYITIK
jgi:SNF2 family DNA or RNA helicase